MSSYVMTCFTATLGIIILSGFINLSAADKDTCELFAAVGQSLTLPFFYVGLTSSHVLRWTHNNTIIFYRQKGKVSIGKSEDITSNGSLLLKNLKSSSAGVYQADVLQPNGTSAWTCRLYVMDKVSKPKLGYTCDTKSNAVKLNCDVAAPQGLLFSWTLDDKTLTSETRPTLSISLAQLKGERGFTCSVANKVSKERSDTVRPKCPTPTPSPPTLLCYASKTVWAVIAGGAGLILLLLVVIITLCCHHRRSRSQTVHRDTRELRMLSISKREPDSISPEYETMHATPHSPPPSPEPSPEACYKSVSQAGAQTEHRPAQLCTAAEGQRPSPVPKPRTKNPQTTNI